MKARLPEGYGKQSINAMMKQAQKMQEDMAAMQEELKTREYRGTSGGDMVEAVVNGDYEVLSVTVKPEVIDPEDAEMLGDLVTAAVNSAIKVAKDDSQKEIDRITGGADMMGLL